MNLSDQMTKLEIQGETVNDVYFHFNRFPMVSEQVL